ncbi:MAG: LacI family DNA-binding transcriptional regulator [Chloroflexi bacterium]|nr:MAG: LacI family transcriptional regulator [Phototrophicales bacterium]RMF81599.1 MAG: LacI family DNA-binding transcriptional regulator [Chloroflexota bacterium]
MSQARRITMNDVAKKAGVSYQTVSRVINNHPSVAVETRYRVLDAINELGYEPSRAAQNLAGRESRTIGAVAFGLNDYGPSQIVINMEKVARDFGYDFLIYNVTEISRGGVMAAIRHFNRWQVDGLFIIPPTIHAVYTDLVSMCNYPIMYIGATPDPRIPSVAIDQKRGSELATEYLIEHGHRQIVEISGPLDWFHARARHEGWRTTMKKHNLEPQYSIAGDWSAASGYCVAQQLLTDTMPMTGVVVANDQMALGALRAFHEAGWRVPEDISLIGFDNIPEAAYFEPPLTTIQQNFKQLALQSIELMIDILKNRDAHSNHALIVPELVVRASVAPST